MSEIRRFQSRVSDLESALTQQGLVILSRAGKIVYMLLGSGLAEILRKPNN